jgi:hypothetical protein
MTDLAKGGNPSQVIMVTEIARPWFLPKFVWRFLLRYIEVRIHTTAKLILKWPPSVMDDHLARQWDAFQRLYGLAPPVERNPIEDEEDDQAD